MRALDRLFTRLFNFITRRRGDGPPADLWGVGLSRMNGMCDLMVLLRPGGPSAKREPSPGGLGVLRRIPSAVGAALYPALTQQARI